MTSCLRFNLLYSVTPKQVSIPHSGTDGIVAHFRERIKKGMQKG